MPHIKTIAQEHNISTKQVNAVCSLLDEGATIPFIARYRKEMTGSLDEVVLADIRDSRERLQKLDKRRETILDSLRERDLLTNELSQAVMQASTLTTLEDIYLPFRPKRRTRAEMAREKDLAPLAEKIWAQSPQDNPLHLAAKFINKGKSVDNAETALAGARDILAEKISEDIQTRKVMRQFFLRKGQVASSVCKGKEAEAATYRDYFDWQEDCAKAPSHRLLAMFRGEREGLLSLSIRPDEEQAIRAIKEHFVHNRSACADQVRLAVEDSYKRLLAPAIETETRNNLKAKADTEAIRVFVGNMRELLLAAPLGRRRILALDPGFRTGAKVACLDEQGNLLHHTTVYPVTGGKKEQEAAETIQALIKKFSLTAVAIGNGTASRETEAFVRGLSLNDSVLIVVVDESGASVYSASATARKEFPDHDVTVRGAVSIGRRLMDPLAELVKIDPKAIGVGQYQHDVDQTALKQSLDDTVTFCVNNVGVELNTASTELLTYVAGLGPSLAENIVAHRTENGPFISRSALKKVKRLGPKAYEQCAGFLRIHGAKNPLDSSAVHPESYKIVEQMAKDLKCTVAELISSDSLRNNIDLSRYVTETTGMPTLRDILKELTRPGRDPRPEFTSFAFADVHSPEDLVEGMELPGIVTNVTQFGAFVDVGVHRDGLVHISQLADRFVKDPADVVTVRQHVRIRVMEVDLERKRIAFTMKGVPQD